MAAIVKRRGLNKGSSKAFFSSFLDGIFTGEADGDFISRVSGVWTNRTAAQVLTALGIEYGTFTPTVTFATVGDLSVTYAEQTGWYTKLPDKRYIAGVRLNFTPTFTTSSGEFRVAGMPVSGNGSWGLGQTENSAGITYIAGRTALIAQIVTSQTYCRFINVGSAVNNSPLQVAGVASGGAIAINFSGMYLGTT